MKKQVALSTDRQLLLAMILDERNAAVRAANSKAADKIRVLADNLGVSGAMFVNEDTLELSYDDGVDSDGPVGGFACVDHVSSDAVHAEFSLTDGAQPCAQGDGDSGEGEGA